MPKLEVESKAVLTKEIILKNSDQTEEMLFIAIVIRITARGDGL